MLTLASTLRTVMIMN